MNRPEKAVDTLDALTRRVVMGSFAGPTLPSWAARLLEGGLGSASGGPARSGLVRPLPALLAFLATSARTPAGADERTDVRPGGVRRSAGHAGRISAWCSSLPGQATWPA